MMTFLGNLSRRHLAWAAIVLAAITLLAVNMFATEGLRQFRADATESNLFTISNSTRSVLGNIDEPIKLRLYYSAKLGERSATYAQHAARIRNLLTDYAAMAKGKLILEVIDPQPFSDDEDRAVAAGLQALNLGDSQGNGYLGLVGTNTTDDREVIAFLSTDRQNFLEYDLTKMVHKLANPKQKVVGLITPLRMAGGRDPQRGQIPPWLFYQQMTEFFSVEFIGRDAPVIPDNVDVLLIVAPGLLTEQLVYAIDQYALAGKPILALLDPFSETSPRIKSKLTEVDRFHKLLKSWGVKLEHEKVVGDLTFARRVQYGSQGQPKVGAYVIWQNHNQRSFEPGNPLFASISNLVIASPGAFSPVDKATTTFTPLIKSSDQAMLIDVKNLAQPDPDALLNSYKPGGKRLVLAARLQGKAETSYPDGPPKPAGDKKVDDKKDASDKKADDLKKNQVKSGDINIIVLSDADLIFDSFWAQIRNVLGRRVAVPAAGNVDFVLNSLENLSGGVALSGLRGRGVEQRPFTLVQSIQKQAEAKYRQREQVLNNKLKQTQTKLREIQSRAQGGNVILSDEDKAAILGFRQEIVAVRKDLRGVQRALHKDIEQLGFWVKFLNIAGMPLLIAVIGLGVATMRRRRPV